MWIFVWDVTSFTTEGVCLCALVNFPLKPLPAIINNKQVEYISAAGFLITSPIRLDGVTLGDRAAVFRGEGGRDGDGLLWWHLLSTNPITSGKCSCHTRLPVVARWSWSSYLEGNVYHPDNMHSSQTSMYIVIYRTGAIPLSGSPLWPPFTNGVWKKPWVTVNHGNSHQPPATCRHAAKEKCDETAVARLLLLLLLLPLQSAPRRTEMYGFSQS